MIVVSAVLLLLLPGVPLAALVFRRVREEIAWIPLACACGLLWSVAGTVVLTLLHLPLSGRTLAAIGLVPLAIVAWQPPLRAMALKTLRGLTWNARYLAISAATIAVLGIAFVTVHDGLPTGDIQKAIYWGEQVRERQRLPAYADAHALNRDPGDFVTPGLHTLTAAVSALSGDPLRGTATFSFVLSLILAGLAAALASFIAPGTHAPILAFLFTALNHRFLRYAFTPGYHYQNLVGEILLFLVLAVLMEMMTGARGRRLFALGAVFLASLAALPLVHQFTAFLAVFLVGGATITALAVRRVDVLAWWRGRPAAQRRIVLLAAAAMGIVSLGIAALSPLQHKLPHLFTTTPHLTGFVIPLTSYTAVLGHVTVFLGIAGILTLPAMKRTARTVTVLAAWTIMLLLLGQGPWIFIDIPSARTLFYVVVPLCVCAGLFVERAVHVAPTLFPRWGHVAAALLLSLPLALAADTAARELMRTDHTPRVNTTVTADTLAFLAFLRSTPPSPEQTGILVDDWNRRRLTWAILSPFRMLTRVGGDLRTIADEATQSSLRNELYAAHLDFEKIFMLGNDPLIASLLERHGIARIAAARGVTDDAFRENPVLREVFASGESVVYEFTPHEPGAPDTVADFLLTPTTLANDVGDREDVLPHTAVSLAATRISDPTIVQGRTTRTVESSSFTIHVNVGTYVAPLWDADNNGTIGVPLRLLLRAVPNSASGTISSGDRTLGTFSLRADDGNVRLTIPAGAQLDPHGFLDITVRTDDAPLILDLIAVGIDN
jgi:hypothetical protein